MEEYYAIGRSTPVSRGDTDDEGVAWDDDVGGGWDEDEHAVRARIESWEGEIARSRRTSEPGSASLSSSPAQRTPHERATARDREARERPPEGRRPEVPSAPVDGDYERGAKSRGLMMEPLKERVDAGLAKHILTCRDYLRQSSSHMGSSRAICLTPRCRFFVGENGQKRM